MVTSGGAKSCSIGQESLDGGSTTQGERKGTYRKLNRRGLVLELQVVAPVSDIGMDGELVGLVASETGP